MPTTVLAWIKIHGPGPINVKSTPPIDGPITLVKLWVAELSAKALTTPSCGTRLTITTSCAAVLNELTIAMRTTSTTMPELEQAGKNQRGKDQGLNQIGKTAQLEHLDAVHAIGDNPADGTEDKTRRKLAES